MHAYLEELLDEHTEKFRVFAGSWGILTKSESGVTTHKSVTDSVAATDDDEPRYISGTCSTESLDRQEETVLARGLDFRPFLEYGWFNDNHSDQTSAVLGWPTKVELRKGLTWYTEGELIKKYPKAEDVWKLAKALRDCGAPRSLGFSIEGKILQRGDNNRILRAVVRNVAITNCPVNQDCNLSILVKAFGSMDAINKAMSVGYGGSTGASVLFNTDADDMSVLEARIRKLRPEWPPNVVKRFALYLQKKEQQC